MKSGGDSVEVVSICLRYFLLARSDGMFATDSGTRHSAHCLAWDDVAFHVDGTQL